MKSCQNALTIARLRIGDMVQLANCIVHTMHGVHTSKAQTQNAGLRAVPCLKREQLQMTPLVNNLLDGCPLSTQWSLPQLHACTVASLIPLQPLPPLIPDVGPYWPFPTFRKPPCLLMMFTPTLTRTAVPSPCPLLPYRRHRCSPPRFSILFGQSSSYTVT